MREIIRFAWGVSSLGDFMVAKSDKGLVAVEFSSRRAAMEDALRVRFPEADVINSQEELTDVLKKVARAIEEPGFNPGVPLDLRGTPFEIGVWSMLRAIPLGETTNYGALAAKLGTRDAREVTEATSPSTCSRGRRLWSARCSAGSGPMVCAASARLTSRSPARTASRFCWPAPRLCAGRRRRARRPRLRRRHHARSGAHRVRRGRAHGGREPGAAGAGDAHRQ